MVTLPKKSDFPPCSLNTVGVIIGLSYLVLQLVQRSQLDVTVVFVPVVSDLFSNFAFQSFKCVAELKLRVGIAGFLTIDLVLELFDLRW